MSTLAWIVVACFAMSAVALVGLASLLFSERRIRALLLPLVAFSAGSLLGGAFLHLIPEAAEARGLDTLTFMMVLLGFAMFFLLEQFLAWHHDHALTPPDKAPVTYLILLADGLHNFIGGLAIGASFLVDVQAGLVTWLAAAAHEVPQELGDFAILRHGGWARTPALLANLISALTIVPGGVLAYYVSAQVDTALLLSFAAGNFIYIAASDLIPEVKQERSVLRGLVHFAAFALGIVLILVTRLLVYR